MPFDRERARADGWTDAQIDNFLAQQAQPDPVAGAQNIPEFLGGIAMPYKLGEELSQMAARAGNMLTPGQPFEVPPEAEQINTRFPVASAIGEALPYTVPGPSGLVPSVAFGAALGSLSDDGPVRGAAFGAAGSGIGYGLGQMAGRVANGIKTAATALGRKARFESGIRMTTGQATGNKALQQLEASLARQPLTSGPFAAIDEANQSALKKSLMRFLGVPDNLDIERGLSVAYRNSTKMIANAVPNEVRIPLPKEFARKAGILQSAGEGFDLADDIAEVTGQNFKDLRSELSAGLKSPKALVRRRAREMIDIMDDAAEQVAGVDTQMYAAGRAQYRAWKTAIAGRGISADMSRINADTMQANLKRGYGEGAIFGGKSTGADHVDQFVKTVKDATKVKSIVPNSGTPTGLAVPLMLGDLATTGGMGSLAAYVGSKASQSGPGLGFALGAMQDPKGLAAVLAGMGRGAAVQVPLAPGEENVQ